MQLTHLGHACLLVEIADARILIDPGTFSSGFEDLTGLDAVLVTHQHPDHLDQDKLPALLAANPDAQLLTDPETAKLLADKEIRVRAHDGSPITIGAVTVTPKGKLHALIQDDLPRITNTGVRIDADGEPCLFHPGDALDAEPGDVDVLAFPLNAPWARSRDMTDFLRRLGAPTAVPIHDGLLNDAGRQLYLKQADQFGGADTEIRDLGDGSPIVFGR